MPLPSEGFFDLQVNGCAGVDFNADSLNAADLHQAASQLEADGVAGALATIITAPIEVMAQRLDRLVALREQDELARRVIRGLHIEGPFLSGEAGFIGAHPPEAVRDADRGLMQRLLDAGRGLVRVVTLAPERDPRPRHPRQGVTRLLSDQGVTVAAGHCDPSRDQLREAIDAGLAMFTHLGNGCPKQMDRHDNIIQRVLSLSEHLWVSFIADGHHLPFFALDNYLRRVPPQRAIIVSDAMAAAACPPGQYQLAGRTIEVGGDGAARLPHSPYLAGATATMPQAAGNLAEHLALDVDAIRRLTIDNPRRALGLTSSN